MLFSICIRQRQGSFGCNPQDDKNDQNMSKRELNKAQREAVEYTSGPLLIVAGAGTGKTTVITSKIAYLIEQGLAKPDEILALTFNDKAALEIHDRVDELIDTGYSDIQISTFHAFCQRLMERHAIDIGLSNQFKLLTKTSAWLFVRKHLDAFNLDYYRPLGNPAKHIHELIRHFSKCKDELITPAEYLEYAEGLAKDNGTVNLEEKTRFTELANAYHTYNQLLLDNALLDFGDLIFYTNKLFSEHKNILAHYQKKYKYILVDEFQDVNWSQYHLIQMLVNGHEDSPLERGVAPQGRGVLSHLKNNNKDLTPPVSRELDTLLSRREIARPILTVVGDDDQSIYAFRGASVSNIMHFKDDFPTAKEIVLNENYRSGQKILDVAYQSIQNNNPDRLEIKLKIDKQLKSRSKSESFVTHIHSHNLAEEVKSVIEEITRLKTIDSDAAWSDFAILARANSHVDPFVEALESRGIPYEFLASAGLFRQSEVLDCLNYLKLLANYQDSPAIFRLLCMPFLQFKESDLQKFTYSAKKKSMTYYEALKRCRELDLSHEGVVTCDAVVAALHDGMKKSRTDKPSALLYAFLEKIGYLKYLIARAEKGHAASALIVKQFFDVLGEFEALNPDSHVAHFLEHFTMILDSGDRGDFEQPESTADAIQILTVHSAKGLEFKYVFVVNLVEERFPTRTKGGDIEIPTELIKEQLPEGDSHYQEERRLFYVAVTRAKERLYFSSANDYGGARAKKVSRFLAEIGYTAKDTTPPKNAIEEKRTAERKAQEAVYELPKKFSFSHIQMYETCPYRYKLYHVLKLPTKGSHYFSFGTSMHSTLQAFYERVQALNSATQTSLFGQLPPFAPEGAAGSGRVKVPPLEDLLTLYEQKWISDWYESSKQREEYYEKGKKILRHFYKAQENAWNVPVFLESGFKIKLGDYTLNGKIDRIDQLPDGTLEIIDYKTGKTKETLTAKDKEQLLIYQIAAQELPEYRHLGTPSKLTFYYLEDDVRTTFIGDNTDLEKIKQTMQGVIGKINERDFDATPSKFACDNCDFRDMCDYRV